MANTFLTAKWRKLAMAQYAVDPEVLARCLPAGVELDLFNGRCFVSLVGFLFDKVKLKGIAVPFHSTFEEVNLRFYVRRVDPDGTVRRGVVFVRELVPKAAITFVAKTFYEEPYATVPMRHAILHGADGLSVTYGWDYGGASWAMSFHADATAVAIEAGSVEEFITEHYWGFTKRSDGGTSQYEVKHPSWVVYPVRTFNIDVNFRVLYGEQFAGLNDHEPESVLLAEGSAVSVDSGSRLPVD